MLKMEQKQHFEYLANVRMPYGKYKDKKIIHVPEEYLLWLKNNTPVKGKLGEAIELIYTMKSNGIVHLLRPFEK